MIYLDNNATTHIDPEVADVIRAAWAQDIANPASQHRQGRAGRALMERSSHAILELAGAHLMGMSADRLILTSGGTEANNLALLGLAGARPGAIVVSAIEHPSILAAAEYLSTTGRVVHTLPVDANGVCDLSPLEPLLEKHQAASEFHPTDRIALVSLMLVNNETGILQPVQELVQRCRPHGILVHSDAIQAIGKIPVSFRSLDLDAMTITAHKLHGPVGIGGLLLRHGIEPRPQLWGGFQQASLRPGTEPAALAVGFAKAVELACTHMSTHAATMQSLRDRLEQTLMEIFLRDPDYGAASNLLPRIIGQGVERAPHTSCISMPGADRQAMQMALDLRGIACSTGSACASGSSQPSHVLKAMGLPDAIVQGALRFSISRLNTTSDIERAAVKIAEVMKSLAKREGGTTSPVAFVPKR